MAGRRLTISTGLIASGTTSTKTKLSVTAPADAWLEVVEVALEYAGVTAAHVGHLWQIVKCSAAGTSTAVTPGKILAADTDAIRSTAGKEHTVEPTAVTVIDEKVISPNGGLYVWNFASIGFVQLKAGETLALRLGSATNDNNFCASMTYVE